MRNITEEEDVVEKVTISIAAEVVVVEITMKREDIQAIKTGMDEAAVEEEVVVQIVQMLNVTIAANMDTTQRIDTPRRRWKKTRI